MTTEIEIARQDGVEKRVVTLNYYDGGVKMFTEDNGPTVKRLFDCSSYEFSTVIEASAMPALALATLAELLRGDPQANTKLQELCDRHGIAYKAEVGTWGF